jgi:two-component system chemotaxis sensor kinase CheA
VLPQSIRVDSSKLDALMRLAGELLVARGALPAFAERLERAGPTAAMAKEMRDAGAKVSRLADDLQATVMSIRMLPVRQVFQKFPRLVRDIARSLDKSIELRVTGEDTELDKTVIESIGDPLTHIIRNAADHGIESKPERVAKGKPALGRIELSAFTRGATVVIEVRDDGKGLDAAKLKQRALDKGLFSATALAAMDEQAAFKIILAAGFSTVDTVTDLSGRGVGMDVVRTAVEALRGIIHISSKPGQGTCFRIELPASLLVSKGILVAVSGQQLMLPMGTIRSMVKLPTSAIRTVQGKQIASVRGAVFPMIYLADNLLASQEKFEDREELSVAVIEAGAGSYGLIVDRFLGEVEVVIKPLTGVLAQLQEYVGAAIMGDGKTVLVVNTERLLLL